MAPRIKALVCLALVGAISSVCSILGHPGQQWLHFLVYLAAVLLSSGMKVALPRAEGSMSLNFPFILLGILQLSPLQAVCLAVCSVIAQCQFRVTKPFTLIQILFNVANVTTATILAWHGYVGLLRLHCEAAPALAIAATIYFFSTTIPVALIIALDQGTNPLDQWRRDFPWFLPFYLVGAMLAVTANLIGAAYGWMTSLLLIPMVYTIYRAYNAQMAIVRDREQHAIDMEALHLRTIESLAMAIEAKDQGTHRHLMRVRVYVAELGKLMGLDRSLMQALLTASFLHDIGKLAVPEYIINKPGKLTPEEFEKMKIHPVVGADILERVRFPYPVVPIVRSHHEAWNGSGYPDGLKGEEIPIGARLLTAVDCFDALASERPYRRALPIDEAMAHIRKRSGIEFDPRIVELLDRHYLELEELARLKIDEMEPLQTDLLVERGAAPGAGFEAAQGDREAGNHVGSSPWAEAVFKMGEMLDRSLSVYETNSTIFTCLRSLIPFDCLAFYLKSEESLIPQFVDGACSKAFSMQTTPIGDGLSGWVAQNGRPIVNGNPTVEPNYRCETRLLTAASSALSIPLMDRSIHQGGVIIGVLTLYSAASAAFSKDHLRILQEIEPRFSLSLQNALRLKITETDAGNGVAAQLPCVQDSEMEPALESAEAL